jgi:PEP-CTERM motif
MASAAAVPVCAWDRPGHTPFMGNVVTAVDRYTDIPQPIREALKRRMAARQYDEIASIERDAIKGRFKYAPDIREMHFANGQVCTTVTRNSWTSAMVERGLVYCESGHCIIVPTVCRNVARITRLTDRVAGGEGRRDGDKPGIEVVSTPAAGPSGELKFDPPAAGPLAGTPSFEQMANDPGSVPPKDPVVAVATPPAPLQIIPLPPPAAVAPADPPSGGSGLIDATPVVPPSPFSPNPPPGLPPGVLVDPLPVPEPGAWLMFLAGLAAVALIVRRRRRD